MCAATRPLCRARGASSDPNHTRPAGGRKASSALAGPGPCTKRSTAPAATQPPTTHTTSGGPGVFACQMWVSRCCHHGPSLAAMVCRSGSRGSIASRQAQGARQPAAAANRTRQAAAASQSSLDMRAMIGRRPAAAPAHTAHSHQTSHQSHHTADSGRRRRRRSVPEGLLRRALPQKNPPPAGFHYG
jgi:hypothetical protein